MHLIAFGDPHIKPVDNSIEYENLDIPRDIDVIVTIGDVIHRPNPPDIAEGRKFFNRLDEQGIPVIAVPGNHDPNEHYKSLIDDCANVVNAHKRVITDKTFQGLESGVFEGHAFVGWGCESREFTPEIRLIDHSSLDPRQGTSIEERRYQSDRTAQRLEDEVYEFLNDSVDRETLTTNLGISDSRPLFYEQLDEAIENYETISDLLSRTDYPTILCTHIPPYNTEIDRHHSIGEREVDLEGLHTGSLGLKLAMRKHRPFLALNGHSHEGAYQPGIGQDVNIHLLNLGLKGIASIQVNAESEMFSYEFLYKDSE